MTTIRRRLRRRRLAAAHLCFGPLLLLALLSRELPPGEVSARSPRADPLRTTGTRRLRASPIAPTTLGVADDGRRGPSRRSAPSPPFPKSSSSLAAFGCARGASNGKVGPLAPATTGRGRVGFGAAVPNFGKAPLPLPSLRASTEGSDDRDVVVGGGGDDGEQLRLRTARSLLGVLSHVQDPDLYSPIWADGARISDEASEANDDDAPSARLVCARADGRGAEPGDILGLYPIHAVGLRIAAGDGGSGDGAGTRDLVLYDADRDGNCFGEDFPEGEKPGGFGGGGAGKGAGRRGKGKRRRGGDGGGRGSAAERRGRSATLRRDVVPLLPELDGRFRALFGSSEDIVAGGEGGGAMAARSCLFVDVNPARPLLPGWMGHLARPASLPPEDDGDDVVEERGNCVVLPLPGAAPLCALVASRPVAAGEELVLRGSSRGALQAGEEEEFEALARVTRERHTVELAELGGYVAMALPPPPPPAEAEAPARREAELEGIDDDDDDDDDDSAAPSSPKEAPAFRHPFHSINASYPGLRILSSSPLIYAVDNFLTPSECDRLIAKAGPHLRPCLTKDTVTGEVRPDDRRTSSDATVPRAEAPSIVRNVLDLTALRPDEEDRLEALQVLRYGPGQEFREHTDGFDGPASACGFVDSGRLVTVFVYLNDVPRGGTTVFPEAGLEIRPRKGAAVVHFPATKGHEEDGRTVHAGTPAADEKWLLATWVWGTPRTEEEYAEGRLPALSDDVI